MEFRKRIWSIEIFESMVAFKVNRIASKLDSYSTDNDGIDDVATDARYHTITSINLIQKVIKRFDVLQKIPLIRYFAKFLRSYIVKINFNAKKYFL